MSDLRLHRYEASDADAWDAFVGDSWNGTFLHSRRFMAHHGDRFADRSLLISDSKGRLVGVLPAALDPEDPATVVSHPGLTYGGIVRGRRLAGVDLVDVMSEVLQHYGQSGLRRLRYKAVPYIYHRVPAGDDLFALSEMGAQRVRCELTTTIPLRAETPSINMSRRQHIRKAIEARVELDEGAEGIDGFWRVLADNLRERYGVAPVDSAEESREFTRRLPENVRCVVAGLNEEVIAGTVLFDTTTVSHTQYFSSNQRGRDIGALDAVIAHAIEMARAQGRWYFDFGTSSDRPLSRLNAGLNRYKLSFGGGGVPHEIYELEVSVEERESADAPIPPQRT